jgi:hypothetical protein
MPRDLLEMRTRFDENKPVTKLSMSTLMQKKRIYKIGENGDVVKYVFMKDVDASPKPTAPAP